MENTYTAKQILPAYGRLLSYSSSKRYGVKENSFGDDVISRLAIDFNQQIKHEHNLDLFELSDREELLTYESIVDDKITSYTYANLIQKETEDEVKAINHSQALPQGYFAEADFDVNKSSVKEYESIGLNEYLIRSYIKNSEYITGIKYIKESDLFNLYFTTKKIALKNKKEAILLIRIAWGIQRKSYDVQEILVFKDKEFIQLHSSPFKMLLRAIDYFGLNINLYDEEKKFFFEKKIHLKKSPRQILVNGVLQPSYSWDPTILKINEPSKPHIDSLFTFHLITPKESKMQEGSKIYFLYAIDKIGYNKFLANSLKE